MFPGQIAFTDTLFRDWIGLAMGAFDTPADTQLAMHIFVADKGDYYEISDTVKHFQQRPQ